jgi:hypothetical protein
MSAATIAVIVLGSAVFSAGIGFVVGVLLTEERIGRWIKDRYGDEL